MSHVDDLLERASAEMQQAVGRMPEREGRTVEQRNTRKNVMTGLVAVVLVVVVGFVGWRAFGQGDAAPIDQPDVPAVADAPPWPGAFDGPGTYLSNSAMVGVPFSFTLEEVDGRVPWAELGRSPWEVGLGHPEATEIGDRELVFMVAHRLSDPETLREPTWPVGDIDGWLEALDPDVLVAGPTEVSVAGREALRFTVSAIAPCDSGQGDVINLPCDTVAFSAEGTGGQLFLESTLAEYEVWWVPGVDGDLAFVAFAAAYPSNWDRWRPTVEAVVESLGIG